MCTTVFPHGNIVHLYHTCRYNRLLKIYTLFICIIHECTLSPWKHCLSVSCMHNSLSLSSCMHNSLSLSSICVQPILPQGNYLKHDKLFVTTKSFSNEFLIDHGTIVFCIMGACTVNASPWKHHVSVFLLFKTICFLYQVN